MLDVEFFYSCNRLLATGNGQWAMGNGQWAMGNGQWAKRIFINLTYQLTY